MVTLGFLVSLSLLCSVQGQVLRGLHFLSEARRERIIWEHEDFPSYEIDPNMEAPKQFSFCLRFFWEYAGQKSTLSESMGILQVWTHDRLNEDGASIEFNMVATYPEFYVDGADTVKDFRKQTNDDNHRENLLRKWNSVCFSVDFEKDLL